jgi:hypothetical protein
MASDERARHLLYDDLGRVLSPESVETLMDYLPPTGWGDVTRRRDLDHLAALLRSEVDQVGAELGGEMRALGADLRGEMAEARTEMIDMHGQSMAAVVGVRAELNREMAAQTRWFVGVLVAMTSVLATLMVALH